jgi:small-conductance mechanosensitive channel/CRP-like cAMP-binding protein
MTNNKPFIRQLGFPIVLNLGLFLYLAEFHSASWWWLTSNTNQIAQTSYFVKGLFFAQFIAIAYLISRLTWYLHNHSIMHASRKVIPKLALHILVILTYTVLALAGLNLVFSLPLEHFLAASGILGFVLGFALRGLLADLFCGIALALDPSIQVGDWVKFNHKGRDYKARFIEFNWRLTVLVDGDGVGILIPNSEFSTLSFENLSRPTPYYWHTVKLQLDISVDQTRVFSILQNALNKIVLEGIVNSSPKPAARMSGISNGLITYTIFFALPPEKANINPIHHILNSSLEFLKVAGINVVNIIHQSQVIHQDRLLATTEATEKVDEFARTQALSTLPFFFFLSRDELALVGKKTISRKIPANTAIFNAGDEGHSMFVVLEGCFQVIIPIDGTPQTVAHIWPGNFFGEMSLFTGEKRSATIIAHENSIVLEIKKEILEDLFKNNPSFAETIAKIIDARIANNASKIENSKLLQTTPEAPKSILGAIKLFFKL